MANDTTLTTNLKLKIDSNLTANAKYNLSKIDSAFGTFQLDSTSAVNIRSKNSILLSPNDSSVGGSGSGGVINLGDPNQLLSQLNINATQVNFGTAQFALKDTATGGTASLLLSYKTDLNGSVDPTNRAFKIDLEGADRNLILGGSVKITGGDLVLNGPANVTLPSTGTLATLAGSESLTNKILDGSLNSISNLTNSAIFASAAIAYSKLALTGSILNADINSSAAIAYSKLSLLNSITNSDVSPTAAISYSKLALSASILDSDVAPSAALAYSKLNLASSLINSDISSSAAIARNKLALGTANEVVINNGSGVLTSEASLATVRGGTGVSGNAVFPTSGTVLSSTNTVTVTNKSMSGSSNTFSAIPYSALSLSLGIINADINASAAIQYSKLNLSNSIVNADVSSSAAIAGTKIAPDFGNQVVRTLAGLQFEEGGYTTDFQAASGGQSVNLTFRLPPTQGTNGQLLSTNGSGDWSWITASGTGTVTSVGLTMPGIFSVSGSPVTAAGTLAVSLANQAANLVFAGPSSAGPSTPTFRSLVLADLPSSLVSSVLDTASVDLTLSSGTLSATVLPAGVDHDSLLNFVANKHIDHSNVVLTAGTGLTGGGDITVNRTFNLANTAVSAGSFGSSTQVANFTVDAQGRLTAASNTSISIANAQVAAGAAIAYSKLNLSNSIVDSDVSASAAIAHSKMAALTANKALQSDASGIVSTSAVTSTELGYLSGVTSAIQTQLNSKATGTSVTSFKADWITADGTTKAITHSLGSTDVMVQIFDKTDGTTILIDQEARTNSNVVTLTSSAAPGAAGWRVLILAI